jgi:hypothetical protein
VSVLFVVILGEIFEGILDWAIVLALDECGI